MTPDPQTPPFPESPVAAGDGRRRQDDPVPVPQGHRVLERLLQQHRHLADALRHPAPEAAGSGSPRPSSCEQLHLALRDGEGRHRRRQAAAGRGRHRLPVHDARKAAASTRTGPRPAATTRSRCCRCASQDESTDRASYALVKEAHCLGHDEPRPPDHRRIPHRAGAAPSTTNSRRGWRQLILKKKSSGPTIGKPSKRSLQLFFMACYDVDRFRAFVASDGFRELYDLPRRRSSTEIARATTSKLMLFGFRFLRQVLFGEESIPVRAEAARTPPRELSREGRAPRTRGGRAPRARRRHDRRSA